jgi:CubicO group peptidase (beta-lactamase class C family)
MMLFEKTSVFLARLVILLLFFLGIGLLIKNLVDNKSDKEQNVPSFLIVPEKSVDSVLSRLSLDEKMDMLFQSDGIDSSKLLEQNTNQFVNLKDTCLLTKDSVSHGNKTNILKKGCFSLIDINNHAVLNSVTDSLFLAEYLLSRPGNLDKWAYSIVNLTMGPTELVCLGDTMFSDFYIKRFSCFKKAFREHNRLLGLKFTSRQLSDFFQLSSKSLNAKRVLSFVIDQPDVLYIDSFLVNQVKPFTFKGILLARLAEMKTNNDQEILGLIKCSPDIYLVSPRKIGFYKDKLSSLIKTAKLSESDLDKKIRKAIKARLWMDMGNRSGKILDNDFHSPDYYASRLSQLSISLLNNPDSLLPVKSISNQKFVVIWIGQTVNNSFKKNCNYYVQPNFVQLIPGKGDWKKKLGNMAKNSFCIYVLDTLLSDSSDVEQFKKMTAPMGPKSSVIVNFKNYHHLEFLPSKIALIQVSSNTDLDYSFTAQAIFGGIAMQGQLPLRVDKYAFGLKKLSPKTRLKYGIPEEVGVNPEKLEEIDRIANTAIGNGAFPGCQVFVAKNGQVVYNKCFGYHTYSHEEPVKEEDVYDLASVTKISATTIAAMKMISDGKMSLTDPLGKFFKDTKIDYTRIKPDTLVNIDTFYKASIVNWNKFLVGKDTTNINDSSFVVVDTVIYKLTPKLNIFKVPLIDLLKHQSGIAPALPIFRYMYYKAYYLKKLKENFIAMHGKNGPLFDYRSFELPNGFPENSKLADSLKAKINKGFKLQYDEYFSTKYVKDSSDIKLTDNLYLRNKYFDTIWRDTKQLPVYGRKVFIYSDINMILMQMAIDSLNQKSIDEFMKKTIYSPLGLKNISYLPLNYFPRSQIIPTEQEKVFRYGYLHGYVHDPSAALLGGMAGNAGLYSSAHDLGVLFQMVLNQGSYGGIKYIDPAVIKQFTARLDETQRGLGFDMPNHKAKVGKKAPQDSFGHSGYTGTCVWVDPENEIVYVFLSNRNHPNESNWRINGQFVRERIHDAIYGAIEQKKTGTDNKKGEGL